MSFTKVLFLFGIIALNISILPQGVFTQWHIPGTPGNSFRMVEYLDASNDIMLVSARYFYVTNLSDNSFVQKLAFKGERSASFLNRSGFAVITCDSGMVYTSTDAGETWKTFDIPGSGYGLDVYAGSGGEIIVATNDQKIFTSTNNGSSFEQSGSLPRAGVPSIAITNGGTFLSGFRGNGKGLLRSTNRGSTWQIVDDTLYIFDLKTFPGSDSIVAVQSKAVSTALLQLMTSTNDGAGWTMTSSHGGYSGDYYFLDPSRFFFISSMTIQYSVNGGQTWVIPANGNVPEGLTWRGASFRDTSNGIAVGIHGNIYSASGSLRTWNKLAGGKNIDGVVLGLIKTPESPSKIKIVTSSVTAVTSDLGTTWTNEGVVATQKFFRQCDGVYVGLGAALYNDPTRMARVRISTDNGVSFTVVYSDTNEAVQAFTRFNQQRMILRRQPLYISSFWDRFTTDGGSTWPFETGISFASNLFKTGEWRALAVTHTAQVDFLSDYGKIKFTLVVPITAKSVTSLAAPSDSVAFLVSENGYILNIHTKNRTLLSWQQPVALDLNYIDMRNSHGIIAGDRGFLLYTTNTGDSWHLLRTVSENNLVQVHFDDDSTAYAVDELGGIIKVGFSNVTGVKEESILTQPVNFSLQQNFPNPFNNSTVINYSVPIEGNVRIVVYDITGTMVTEIAKGFHRAGEYRADINATGLTSGVYFYVLESGGVRIARKLVLLK